MKHTITAIALVAGLASTPMAHADRDWHWGHHGHHHHHHHGHHHHHHHRHWGYYPPRPVYYPAPVAPAYYPPPAMYREIPVYRPPHGGLSEIIPMAAGGIIGGVVGDQAGYGNPAAVITGSVLGSVLGHEIAR